MKVGDLVTPRDYNAQGRLAIVVEIPWHGSSAMKVCFFDTGKKVATLTSHFKIVSEARDEVQKK